VLAIDTAKRWRDGWLMMPPAQHAAPAHPPQAYAEPAPAQAPAAPPQPVDMNDRLAQLKQLGELLSAGVLTQAEFEQQKARILNG
jgi:hypothetical protein